MLRKLFGLNRSKLKGGNEMFRKYDASRKIKDRKYLCHAPYNNMYINTEGHIAVCWLTFNNPVVYTEDQSLKEIWTSGKFKALREHIEAEDLAYQCGTCEKHINEGNFVNVLARAYDNDYELTDWPSIIEFELENTCNLACTMCNGMLSSVIRRDREKLPKLESPYGEKFLEELREFIPHLKEARFNGGEPFLIKKYYRIWDMIFELNPDCKMVIATNGTVLTSKVKDYLSRGNFHLNISMDGFSKETYEAVRVRGDHDKLMENFEWFNQYCKDNDRTLCIMINPMRQNWWEMSDFVNWCNDKDVHLWFNTIVRPEDQAVWNLPAGELERIYNTLSAVELNGNKNARRGIYDYNVRTYKNLVEQQIKTWLEEAREREHSGKDKTTAINTLRSALLQNVDRAVESDKDSFDRVAHIFREIEKEMDEGEMLEFYTKVNQAPVEVIVDDCLQKPFDEVKEAALSSIGVNQ